MRKELNYQFFDIQINPQINQSAVNSGGTKATQWVNEIQDSIQNAAQVKVSMSEPPVVGNDQYLDLQELRSEIAELQKNAKLRNDRINNALQKLETNQIQLNTEIAEKFALMIQKLNDQKKYDQKVQDIVDRHNNLLKGYEVRMNQMQKLIHQKEADYNEASAALREVKAELVRLKRL